MNFFEDRKDTFFCDSFFINPDEADERKEVVLSCMNLKMNKLTVDTKFVCILPCKHVLDWK